MIDVADIVNQHMNCDDRRLSCGQQRKIRKGRSENENDELRKRYCMVLKDRRRNERNLSGPRKPLYFCCTRKHDQHEQLLDLLIQGG